MYRILNSWPNSGRAVDIDACQNCHTQKDDCSSTALGHDKSVTMCPRTGSKQHWPRGPSIAQIRYVLQAKNLMYINKRYCYQHSTSVWLYILFSTHLFRLQLHIEPGFGPRYVIVSAGLHIVLIIPMYWAICGIFMYDLVLLELWKMVWMLCFMGWCSFIGRYLIFSLQMFNNNISVELEILYITKRNFKMQFRKYCIWWY